MSDPTDLALIDELRFRTGRRIKVLIAGDRELAAAIRRRYGLGGEATEAIALEGETTGEGVQLAEPFEGGSTEAMTANLASSPLRRPSPPPLLAGAPVRHRRHRHRRPARDGAPVHLPVRRPSRSRRARRRCSTRWSARWPARRTPPAWSGRGGCSSCWPGSWCAAGWCRSGSSWRSWTLMLDGAPPGR